MDYFLCVKPRDKNLLNIISGEEMGKAFFAEYSIVAAADDEQEAFAAAAALIQDFCDVRGSADFSGFRDWLISQALEGVGA